jgi:hypothetical protein
MFITHLGLKVGPNIKLNITKRVGIYSYDERTPMVWMQRLNLFLNLISSYKTYFLVNFKLL